MNRREFSAHLAAVATQEDGIAVATKANTSKFPQYKSDQKCSNCQLYLGAGPSAACSIFGNKQVPAGAWCSAWVKKV